MKRVAYIIIVYLLLSGLLCGCSLSGSIYENYREVEQLRLVEVMGIDSHNGGTVLSVAVGPGVGQSAAPILMHAAGSSISAAVSTLQDYSSSEDLFYSHTQYLVFGAEASQTQLEHYLDYVNRSPSLRTGISMYVVRNGTAQALIEGTGGESYDLSSVLASLERDAEKRGEVCIFSALDVIRALTRSGAALVPALDIRDMSSLSSESEGEGKTAIPAGYCIINGGSADGYIIGKPAAVVGMLLNRADELPIELPDGEGGETTVTLTGSKCEIKPVWENGQPLRFDISFDLKAAIVELEDPLSLTGSGTPELLAGRLEETVCAWAKQVLEQSRELGADFLALGVKAQADQPKRFAALEGGWQQQFGSVEFSITASAEVERSYDLTEPAHTEGGQSA